MALPNAELVLAGEVRPEMNALLETHADSSVRKLGFLSVRELVKAYQESDVFVFPSVNEGFAQVLLEAMACGLPVVATELSGAKDCVTEGKEGFIVPARDVDRLAEAILWCYQHRDETRAMGKAARARIESQFTLEHYNQRMIALYNELASVTT
jgi:starch synthase